MSRRNRKPPRREFLTAQHLRAHPRYESGAYVPPTEAEQAFRDALFTRLREHPPRVIDVTVFWPHRLDCPDCRCARHCRCFDDYYRQQDIEEEHRIMFGDPSAPKPQGVIQA